MMEELKSRQAEMLKYLITSSVPLNIEFFKNKFYKSDRTIRYDIKQLKKICALYHIEIAYLVKKGYYIPISQKKDGLQLLAQCNIETKNKLSKFEEKERLVRIYLYLFVNNSFVKTEKIASNYFVSRSTLIRILNKMTAHFGNRFSLDAKKSLGYRLTGDELILRKIAVEIIAAKFKGSYAIEDWFSILPEEVKRKVSLHEMIDIDKKIRQINFKYNIWFSYSAYLNLFSYCIVRAVRLRNEQLNEYDSFITIGEKTYLQELINELSIMGKGRTVNELKWLSEILADNGIYTEECIAEAELVDRIVEKIITRVEKENERFDFNIEQLKQDLSKHLKNFMSMRLRKDQQGENYQIIEEVKKYCHAYLSLGRDCVDIIEREAGVILNNTESCYLTLYLYKNGVKEKSDIKNVMIVCATGKGLSYLLTLRVKSVFPMLNIVDHVSPYQLFRSSGLQNKVDFIISTIPLDNCYVPVVKVSSILSYEDIERINAFLKYGKLMDDVAINIKNEDLLMDKEVSLLPVEGSVPIEREGMIRATNTLNKLILIFLEYTSKFPEQFQMSSDSMLGIIIHLSVAVPRWFDNSSKVEEVEEYEKKYRMIREIYPQIFLLMDKFFKLAENTLQVKIPTFEKVAFFLYIIPYKIEEEY